MRSARREARVGAAFIAAFVLLCQAAAWVHVAATPHVTCFEHGESVHLAAAGGGDARATSPDDAISEAPAASTTHGHEHCGLQGHRTTITAGAPPVASLVAALAPRVRVEGRAAFTAGLFRLAPKTSPPSPSTV